MHLVDEDTMTIVRSGGKWDDGSSAGGITIRFMYDTPSLPSSHVASSNMKKYRIVRIFIMSTKI